MRLSLYRPAKDLEEKSTIDEEVAKGKGTARKEVTESEKEERYRLLLNECGPFWFHCMWHSVIPR